jgi:hypothetical protein
MKQRLGVRMGERRILGVRSEDVEFRRNLLPND